MATFGSDEILRMGLSLQIVSDCCRKMTMAEMFAYLGQKLSPNSSALDAAEILIAPPATVADILAPFPPAHNLSSDFEFLIRDSRQADIRYNYIPGINMTLLLAILSTLIRITGRLTTPEVSPLGPTDIAGAKRKRCCMRLSKLQASDWLILVAMISSSAFCTAGLFGLKYFRIGTHIWGTTYWEYLGYIKLRYWGELWYLPALGCLKCSLLAFYLSLTPNGVFRKCCWALAIFTALLTTQMDIMLAFACKPILFWHDLLNYKCISHDAAKAAYYLQNITNILTDFAILILPIPLVWRLQFDLRNKLLAIGLFSLGSFACTASIIRSMTLGKFAENADPTWAAGFTLVWSALELNIGILCGNIPLCRTFLVRLFSQCICRRKNSKSLHERLANSSLFRLRASKEVNVSGRGRSDTGDSMASFDFHDDRRPAGVHCAHHLDDIKEEDIEDKGGFIGIALAPCSNVSIVQVERIV